MIKHPLDDVFNITGEVDIPGPGQAIASVADLAGDLPQAQPTPDIKDADDVLVEERLDLVYDEALSAFRNLNAYTEVIEPRYAARNAEVAANYLNIALAAATSRAKVKVDRKRGNQFVPNGQGRNTADIVIANREAILQMISVDNETKQVK